MRPHERRQILIGDGCRTSREIVYELRRIDRIGDRLPHAHVVERRVLRVHLNAFDLVSILEDDPQIGNVFQLHVLLRRGFELPIDIVRPKFVHFRVFVGDELYDDGVELRLPEKIVDVRHEGHVVAAHPFLEQERPRTHGIRVERNIIDVVILPENVLRNDLVRVIAFAEQRVDRG